MDLKKPLYLKSGILKGGVGRQNQTPISKFFTVVFILTLIVVNYLVFFRDAEKPQDRPGLKPRKVQKNDGTDPKHKNDRKERRTSPLVPDDSREEPSQTVAGKLLRGETVIESLRKHNLSTKQILPVINAMREVFNFRAAQAGNQYSFRLDKQSRVTRLEYKTSPLNIYVVTLDPKTGGYRAIKQHVEVDTRIVKLGCAVRKHIFESISRCGESPVLAGLIADLFAYDLNLFLQMRQGDHFKVIVEKVFVKGKFYSYGKLLAAEYQGKFGTLQLFQHKPRKQPEGYYSWDGESAKRRFLKTPLKLTRRYGRAPADFYTVSTHTWKKQVALDYQAPRNTPVWAVDGGSVVFSGPKSGYGNLVAIKHEHGFTSYYAHLKRIPRGLKVGETVTAKQVVGYVGVPPKSKTPHLHFVLKKGQRFVRFDRLRSRPQHKLDEDALTRFRKAVESLREQLKTIRVLSIHERRV
ncbi:MAG: M23 family metallopeptidase [Myxococcales bacterium]|nr:M23 family metallopeptidase [Myxococcales bacterium]